MSEVTGDPSAEAAAAAAAPPEAAEAPAPREKREATIRSLLECGAHFGHQTRRWDPKMKPFIFGERDGIHIIDLDKTLPRLIEALEFIREIVAQGGKLLFVGTKRQAQETVRSEAERSGQYYVNNRWLGGMLTNFRTVRRSIERFKEELELVADEEKVAELSKKELSRLNRGITKYRKSLDGLKDMQRLPDVMFVMDLKKEHIAISEGQRLGIPIVAIVDTNCSPERIDFPIPANDDAIRAIQLYCELVADACLEGAELFNERVQSDVSDAADDGKVATGRRVVEIKQQGRERPAQRGGRGGGRQRPRQAGGSYSAGGRDDARGPAPAAAASAEAPATEVPAAEAPVAEAAPTEAPSTEAAPADAPKPEGGASE
jgi:small subunit ribosomal protein S2